MTVEFWNPSGYALPTKLRAIVDGRYVLEYVVDESQKRFEFTFDFKDHSAVKFDIIKAIMMELASKITKQFEGHWDFKDFEIISMLSSSCKFALIFQNPETR